MLYEVITPIDNGWYVFVMLGLLFLFWLYARYIERVDISLVTVRLKVKLEALAAQRLGHGTDLRRRTRQTNA